MWTARLILLCAAGALGAAPARPLAADPGIISSAGRATRKQSSLPADRGAASADVAVPTWATLFNVHTGEVLALSADDPPSPWFDQLLRDRATGAIAPIDPKLLELLRQVARRHEGARIELVSGYRSPKLNEMLRKKGHRVASSSQHTLGHAVDFRVIGLTPRELAAEVANLGWEGGLGRYDQASDAFVHADVGRKRGWLGDGADGRAR
jgi:uncharacterized protein YcbK (DUF882 family)